MKLFRNVVFSMLILSILFSSQAFADSDASQQLLPPTPGVLPDSPFEPLNAGELYQDQIKALSSGNKKVLAQPQAIGLIYDLYEVTDIYSRYDGYYDIGKVGVANNYRDALDTITVGITHSVSNKVSTSLSFSKAVISAAVGYDVTWGTTLSWTYSCQVPGHTSVTIYERDWYHVQKFHLKITHVNTYTKIDWCEYGSGFACQWAFPEFSSR